MMAKNLTRDIDFDALYNREALLKLDADFCDFLKTRDQELSIRLQEVRDGTIDLSEKDESGFIIALAPHLEDYLKSFFGIEVEADALSKEHTKLAPLYKAKRLFVQRKAARYLKPDQLEALDVADLDERITGLLGEGFTELAFAEKALSCIDADEKLDFEDDLLTYASFALLHPVGQKRHKDSILFKTPKKLDFENLLDVHRKEHDFGRSIELHEGEIEQRDGFDLTDKGVSIEKALDEAHYCIQCHPQGKDSCSKGLKDRKTGEFQKSAHDVTLTGCPLEEKISEMNELKKEGFVLSALAAITIDNPLCAATGHRICNDCMKACIYQKQQPVDVPAIETNILKSVLSLPWGFEIYSLLTRWNPLNFKRPYPKEKSGYKVLIVGMGPAGFNLAHHLLQEGHEVLGVDGLKIEPLPDDIIRSPLHDIAEIYENLSDRIVGGFGGVAEYGITVRWDKNNLKIIRLLLERRDHFILKGGVRFGSQLTMEHAFAEGVDHIALCAGAGRPRFVEMKNAFAPGVRMASDFLMSLQLTGAAKKDSLANLEVQLPVVVIGGGLTAIDTATEALAYYPVQVEKFLKRFEALNISVNELWQSPEELIIAERFIAHAKEIREEKKKANPDIISLLKKWGGAKVLYRGSLQKAPSYRLNHEEVHFALQEGITFCEKVKPSEVLLDEYSRARGIKVENREGGFADIEARTILVAAGTQPNSIFAKENPGMVEMDGKYFQAINEQGEAVIPAPMPKPDDVHVYMHKTKDSKFMSFFGDLHPSFAGNVVKAMASAKQGYPAVNHALSLRKPNDLSLMGLAGDLTATIEKVVELAPNIVEVIVKAPLATRNFKPGQFYRLQNFESYAPSYQGTKMAMEGLALTGASVDVEAGTISLIVLEMGGSSDLCRLLNPGEPVILMGPTGEPTEIPKNEKVCLVGGGLGNAVLFSIGQAMRQNGCEVLYFAGYKKNQDRYKVDEIRKAADQVIWCCDEKPDWGDLNEGESVFHGNIVQAIETYGRGDLSGNVPLDAVDRMIVIGSDRMMAAVKRARYGVLKPYLKADHIAIGSINSPMQCMMKEICAQCIQLHKDPVTKEQRVVYSCTNQDQRLDVVDFDVLRDRLRQNNVQEKLTAKWIAYCLDRQDIRKSA
jgi:NADPH-dependent glutamate synthase beta subunit-like oxidoreductase/NAD(P)H-flavin reductase